MFWKYLLVIETYLQYFIKLNQALSYTKEELFCIDLQPQELDKCYGPS